MIECYASNSNPLNIEDKIFSLCNNSITKKKIMIKLKIRYAYVSKILNKMIDKKKLRIVKRRPLTVQNHR